MNKHSWAWARFQRRTGWIFGPGETALCAFGITIIVLFGADAIRAYFELVRILGNWIAGSAP